MTTNQLAHGRTVLAIERTFLAYTRTALALFVAGATLIEFFQSPWFQLVGLLCTVLAIPLFCFGVLISFLRVKDS